jgi:AraC-like DNA-binding protein
MIERLKEIIEERLDDNTLTNKEIATYFKVSERTFTRRVKEATGESPNKFIRDYRLNRAMDFIVLGEYVTVSELSNAVGFSRPDYFSHRFKENFKKRPLEVLKEKGWR